jgi:hypothetical protein
VIEHLPASKRPNKNLVAATSAKDFTPAIPTVIAPQENIKNAIQVEGANFFNR